MTKQEKQSLASEIAKIEIEMQSATSEKERKVAAQKIFELSEKIESIDDFFEIDEYILKILEK